MSIPYQTHNLTLPEFGPYTKRYSGISHVPASNKGFRFDLAVFPGLYRRRVDVPNVRFESGFHPWRADAQLKCYTFRHEIEWKDRVYADVSFCELDGDARLVRVECVNDTDAPQNLVLHFMASMHRPVPSYRKFSIPTCRIALPDGAALVFANDFDELHFARPRPDDNLCYDGLRRAEEPVEGFVQGYGIGRTFGADPDDRVSYQFKLAQSLESPCLCIRYLNASDEPARYHLATGERVVLAPTLAPSLAICRLDRPLSHGDQRIELVSEGTAAAKLDFLCLCEADCAHEISIEPIEDDCTPNVEHIGDNCLVLKYPAADEYYGLTWAYPDAEIRTILNDELDIFLRDTVQDHVSSVLRGNKLGCYTNVFMRPIPIAPRSSRVLYGTLCREYSLADATARCQHLAGLNSKYDDIWRACNCKCDAMPALPAGERFQLGQQLIRATLCTNVVYPVYTRRQYILHNTPGRWWDSLYTWDSGFVGMGLLQYSTRRAYDCLNAYLTAEGDDEAAFIHHGSLVPTQAYLFAELYNRTGDMELVRSCYPRLRQYYLFFTGQSGSSTLDNLDSGLLRPWDYFYNSGGWDDYPPQKYVHAQGLEATCTPVVTTAHAIRFAKILAYFAEMLDRTQDVAGYAADITRLTSALDDWSWDDESGYYGYVLHDAQRRPAGIVHHESGQNYNMGMDGASPLFAGACPDRRAQRIMQRLADPNHLWTEYGLSTVDRSAAYFRRDGYWNGAVWMPYQWLFFKAALDMGETEFAYRLACAVLNTWERECRESYNCFEHFMLETGRGAGWHQFGGLSAPVAQLFQAYYVPGTITTGHDTFVKRAVWRDDYAALTACLSATRAGRQSVLVALTPGNYAATADVALDVRCRHDGLLELSFVTDAPGELHLHISRA